MSSWFRFLRNRKSAAFAALFSTVALLVAYSTGCGSSVVPSGFNSAANGQQVIASGTPHMIGFRVSDTLPPGQGYKIDPGMGDVWFFATTNRTNTAGPAMTTVTFLVNGTPQPTSKAKVVALSTKTVWIQTFGLASGSLCQLDATVNGSARLSNQITLPAGGPFPPDNNPPGFAVVQPAQAAGSAAPHTPLEFAHQQPAAVVSYFSLVLDLNVGLTGNTLVVVDVPHCCEMLQPTTYTPGQSFPGLVAAFKNAAIGGAQGVGFFFNIVSLDANGFGNGTTSDGDFTSPGNWIFFN